MIAILIQTRCTNNIIIELRWVIPGGFLHAPIYKKLKNKL